MSGQPKEGGDFKRPNERGRPLLWVSGAWVLPFLGITFWIFPGSAFVNTVVSILAILAAPLPSLVYMHRQRKHLVEWAEKVEENAAQLKLQLETVRFRTARLREELQAADRQARLSHQLSLLGQFTAGFMHEFNNPLAIVSGRLEVLLEERKDDSALCADIEQMLKETRYMSNIATTLLQALRRERGGEVFDASVPQKALKEAMEAFAPKARSQDVQLVEEFGEAPRVDVPEHVVGEVVRCLLGNALEALNG